MRILIVDDDELKTTRINELITKAIDGCVVSVKKSLNSALLDLRKNTYDIILLDMSMPTFDEDSSNNFNSFGGITFLREMKRKNNNIPVVIVTQYEIFGEGEARKTADSIDKECQVNFINYKGIVIYSSLQNEWKEKLLKIIWS